MIGLKRGTVKLVPHNPKWEKLFEKEKKVLEKKLGNLVIDIEHVGSTSVPGISAKPVIDILVGIKSMTDAKKCIKQLESLGYEYMPDRGEKGRRIFFAKGSHKRRTHHIHLVKFGGKVWESHILFAEYLRRHKKRAKQYDALKKSLLKKFEKDRESYTKSKAKFIRETIKKSRLTL